MIPSHLPTTYSARASGRARRASEIPDSTSDESAGDELGHALRLDATDKEHALTVVVQLAVAAERRTGLAGEAGDAQPYRARAEEVRQRALGDDAATVDDRHAVADLLHLREEVGVEE